MLRGRRLPEERYFLLQGIRLQFRPEVELLQLRYAEVFAFRTVLDDFRPLVRLANRLELRRGV